MLTKADYENYVRATTSLHCKVFDHHDNYKDPPVLPLGTQLLERTIYVLTDAPYKVRENMWNDLRERSSRSDCIIPTPFGKDPYTIVVKAECYLLGTSVATVATKIKSALLKYYAESIGEKIPDKSMIDYIVHRASDAVLRLDSLIVRDSTYGTIDSTFNDVGTLSNTDIDNLFDAINSGDIGFHIDVKHDGAEPGEEFGETERHYYLLGMREEDDTTKYYNKYPLVINSVDGTNGYAKFPDKFPDIYYVNGDTETKIEDYIELVNHQVVYGELDSEKWDYVDSDICAYTLTGSPYTPPEEIGPEGQLAEVEIDPYYELHHYMVPVLNNVVVLIKAVTK